MRKKQQYVNFCLETPPFHNSTRTMPSNATEIEANIAAASAAMDANPRLKASVAARQFSAPYCLLLRRRAGFHPVIVEGRTIRSSIQCRINILLFYSYL